MKTSIWVVALGILLVFFITGCDKRQIDMPTSPQDISPDDADWVLAFNRIIDYTIDSYFINLYSTADITSAMEEDSVSLTLGTQTFPLIYHEDTDSTGHWTAESLYPVSEQKSIQLYINGNKVLDSYVRPVGKASAAFPSYYHVYESLKLNWSVYGQSDYQLVRALVYEDIDDEKSRDITILDTYIRTLGAYIRSFTFPANCVSINIFSPNQQIVSLAVAELNYRVVGKTAMMSYHYETQGYSVNKGTGQKDVKGIEPIEIYKLLNGSVNTDN